MSFCERWDSLPAEKEAVHVAWLGQAGFLLKAGGRTVAIDPYLTDSLYEQTKGQFGYGYKRLSAPLFRPGELHIDVVLCTHEHEDHMDAAGIVPMTANGETVLYATAEAAAVALSAGCDPARVRAVAWGDAVDMDGFRLLVLPADHGDQAPTAAGFLLDFGITSIYYSGDTCYNPERLRPAIEKRPELALLPINGAYGNLDGETAALLARDLGSRTCIPHHFYTFPMHFGDPMQAIECFPKAAPGCALLFLSPGEILSWPKGEVLP